MLAENLRQIMKKRKMGNKELSQRSNLPLGTLNKIIYGETENPTLDTVRALAIALDCTLDDFVESERALSFSMKESTIIEKYRTLDKSGKNAVDFILDNEYTRCNDFLKADEDASKIAEELTAAMNAPNKNII